MIPRPPLLQRARNGRKRSTDHPPPPPRPATWLTTAWQVHTSTIVPQLISQVARFAPSPNTSWGFSPFFWINKKRRGRFTYDLASYPARRSAGMSWFEKGMYHSPTLWVVRVGAASHVLVASRSKPTISSRLIMSGS